MTRERLNQVVVEELRRLAPELDPAALREGVRIREDLDLDSFDFVRFLAALDQRLGLSIPEADYAQLVTIADCLDYLEKRLHS